MVREHFAEAQTFFFFFFKQTQQFYINRNKKKAEQPVILDSPEGQGPNSEWLFCLGLDSCTISACHPLAATDTFINSSHLISTSAIFCDGFILSISRLMASEAL